jgi:Bacterial regulatory proteins, tetR family
MAAKKGPHSASELFYRRGLRAVGVEAIAQAARTNKTTLFGISRRRMTW